jgi:hypothetical protein
VLSEGGKKEAKYNGANWYNEENHLIVGCHKKQTYAKLKRTLVATSYGKQVPVFHSLPQKGQKEET